ncbi:MAG: hypothetical protein WDZ80_04445 [Candidatus Paceibacterota bacterium]
MYIPAWLLIGTIIFGIYFYRKSKKRNLVNSNTPEILKNKFSYKLDIYIEPNWFELYKKTSPGKSEKELEKEFIEKTEKSENTNNDLVGRRYFFTEYYDSATGLTTRFQKVFYSSGKQFFYPVDEFGDRGYFFHSDWGLRNKESNNDRERRKKLTIEIGENYIRNEIFDKYIGGPRSDFNYEKENYLFQFPLSEIFNFLFALGQRFHDTEDKSIIKWPDHIEKKFNDLGIKYKTYFDYEPTEFNIEEHDKQLYEKLGKLKIALYGDDKGYLSAKEAYFGVSLKIFRPGENDRIRVE